MRTRLAAVAVGALGLAGGYAVGYAVDSSPQAVTVVAPATPRTCDLLGVPVEDAICFTVGELPTSLYNLQAAKQFCAWRNANPGAWTRLKAYSATGADPAPNNTFFGAHIQNVIETYRFNGLTGWNIAPFAGTNAC